MSESLSPSSRVVPCSRAADGSSVLADSSDVVVVEEPLELRVDGRAIATLMRTPSDDRDLALGFFFGEGWIESPSDVMALQICGSAAEASEANNVVDLRPRPGLRPPATGEDRMVSTSSCGVCGKRTIDEVFALAPRADSTRLDSRSGAPLRIPRSSFAFFAERLRAGQEVFASTGALHGAALFEGDACRVIREDVGRHNAVDKVIGWAFLNERLALDRCVLQVSGRVSFEIVQKAYRARIPVISAVSGVSSLAIDLAERAGITLVGFLRGTSFNVYSGAERLE